MIGSLISTAIFGSLCLLIILYQVPKPKKSRYVDDFEEWKKQQKSKNTESLVDDFVLYDEVSTSSDLLIIE